MSNLKSVNLVVEQDALYRIWYSAGIYFLQKMCWWTKQNIRPHARLLPGFGVKDERPKAPNVTSSDVALIRSYVGH